MAEAADEDHKTRKRRRLGTFPCPKCSKVFSRSDHLNRHFLNHQPKEVFECTHVILAINGTRRPCGKTFVRKDLCDRHMRRHIEEENGVKADPDPEPQQAGPPLHLALDMPEAGTSAPQESLAAHFSSFPVNMPLGPQGLHPRPHMAPTLSAQMPQLPAQMPLHMPPTLPPQGPKFATQLSNDQPALNSSASAQAHMPIPQLHPGTHAQDQAFPHGLPEPFMSHDPAGYLAQNDILSWLFTESPQGLDKFDAWPQKLPVSGLPLTHVSSPSSISTIRPQPTPQTHTPLHATPLPQLQMPFEASQGFVLQARFQGMADPMGLLDLNFFSNSDNPLDELFLTQDAQLRPFLMSTASLASPTNTLELITPRNTESESLEEIAHQRLLAHAGRNTPQNKHIYISSNILVALAASLSVLLPAIANLFTTHSLETRTLLYLAAYWDVFHTQYLMLHRPSFNTETAEPLLLCAMLLVGAMHSALSLQWLAEKKHCPEYEFCMAVATPLRFALFQHPEFKLPVRVWILQALNLLEYVEKNYLLRRMHERAHIHHGTTVQLLRRLPLLGGNPLVKNKVADHAASSAEESDGTEMEEPASNDQALFDKWVESELMKRVTFMTFYWDTIDYIKFRHHPQIPFFQLQLLNLPCDDDSIWNSAEVCGLFRKVVKRQRKLLRMGGLKDPARIRPGMNFLAALKRAMKPRRTGKVLMFTSAILFGGLVLVMHQMQQAELQLAFAFFIGRDKANGAWKRLLSDAMDAWDSLFIRDDRMCVFPMYHLAPIIGMGDVNHYDIAIFGGSPGNQSVEATLKDLAIVQRKLNAMWRTRKLAGDLLNMKSVVHSLWLLWRLMLLPMDEEPVMHDWHADHDYHDAMYAVSIATLVLWCYAYLKYGTESLVYEEMPVEELRRFEVVSPLAAEDGYRYLQRVRQELVYLANKEKPDVYVLHRQGARGVRTCDIVTKYCDLLPSVLEQQNISGLCFLVGTRLLQSQWQIVRENAKLIINCGLRSIGKTAVQCPDLFDEDLE